MAKKQIYMVLTKSTKGTHVYGSEVEGAPVQTVYIDRASLPKTPPVKLMLTIEWNEENAN